MNYRRHSGTFHFEEDVFSKGAQGFSKIYHEVLLLMIFFHNLSLRLELWIRIIMICITLWLKIEEIVNDDEYENDYIIFVDFITPNHYIGIKNDDVILR